MARLLTIAAHRFVVRTLGALVGRFGAAPKAVVERRPGTGWRSALRRASGGRGCGILLLRSWILTCLADGLRSVECLVFDRGSFVRKNDLIKLIERGVVDIEELFAKSLDFALL